jgi:hypothetical protein
MTFQAPTNIWRNQGAIFLAASHLCQIGNKALNRGRLLDLVACGVLIAVPNFDTDHYMRALLVEEISSVFKPLTRQLVIFPRPSPPRTCSNDLGFNTDIKTPSGSKYKTEYYLVYLQNACIIDASLVCGPLSSYRGPLSFSARWVLPQSMRCYGLYVESLARGLTVR